MSQDTLDHTLIAALAGSLVTLVGAVLTFWVRSKRTDGDYWTQLQNAQAKFRAEIHEELEQTKKERNEMRAKIDELEKRVRELVSQNERLMLEKIEWMQKATSLQMLLQKAMQGIGVDTNQATAAWLKEEADKLAKETNHEQ